MRKAVRRCTGLCATLDCALSLTHCNIKTLSPAAQVPPLRVRPQDIAALQAFFLRERERRSGPRSLLAAAPSSVGDGPGSSRLPALQQAAGGGRGGRSRGRGQQKLALTPAALRHIESCVHAPVAQDRAGCQERQG